MNTTSVKRAIYGKLAGDSTLNALLASPPSTLHPSEPWASAYTKSIFFGFAPDKAEFPFVLFSKVSGIPTYANATKPAYETDVWEIKAVDRQSTSDRAEAVSARLQTLLNDAGLSISGATEMWFRRQGDIEYPEVSDGIRYFHSGSLYRLIFEPA